MLNNIINNHQRQRMQNLNRIATQISTEQITRRRNRHLLFRLNGREIINNNVHNEEELAETYLNNSENIVLNNEPILQIPIEQSNNENNENNELNFYEEHMNNNLSLLNNINDLNNNSRYYSNFIVNEYNIRLFHNNEIDIIEYTNIINYILNITYENELNNAMNESMNDTQIQNNNKETIDMINNNITKNTFFNLKDKIKNEVCPITLKQFENNDIIYRFNNCNHAISEESYEQYCSLFKNCPLCKSLLY